MSELPSMQPGWFQIAWSLDPPALAPSEHAGFTQLRSWARGFYPARVAANSTDQTTASG